MRDYLGKERLDTVAQVCLLNHVYNQLWLYDNFFQPVRRMVKAFVVDSQGQRRVQRTFDEASPPLDRLVKAGVLTLGMQEVLLRWRERIHLM